jgi:hypothetical protein
MSTPSITHGELIANITANGSSYWVSICIDSGENFMGQQVIKSRSYSSLKTAQRGAIKMMETLA